MLMPDDDRYYCLYSPAMEAYISGGGIDNGVKWLVDVKSRIDEEDAAYIFTMNNLKNMYTRHLSGRGSTRLKSIPARLVGRVLTSGDVLYVVPCVIITDEGGTQYRVVDHLNAYPYDSEVQ